MRELNLNRVEFVYCVFGKPKEYERGILNELSKNISRKGDMTFSKKRSKLARYITLDACKITKID
jgi:hypothetical protein